MDMLLYAILNKKIKTSGAVDLSEYAKKEDLVGQKTADGGEIFNDYENNVATNNSHAEGCNTTASGNNSHAEGCNTTASGNNSHAEGYYTKASGDYSHAEGYYTKATEKYAHAEGYDTTASGRGSHAEGCDTKASSNWQHVQGKFNVEDSESKYAFIIGNGYADSNRSNAIAIDWDGLIYLNNSDAGIDLSNLTTKEEVAQAVEYAHTHENKETLDEITKISWSRVTNQAHSHNNIYELNSISPAFIQAVNNILPERIYELQHKFESTQSTITVYVDAASGSDSNNGNTSGTAFQTLDKALDAVSYCKKAIIYLAAGTYTIPDKTVTFLGKDIRIYGNTKEDTIIQGNIVAENSFLRLARVTVDSTDSETANVSANTITAQYGTILRMDSCIVNTAYNMCVNCTETSKSYLTNCTFSGALQYAVHTTGYGDVRIYQCSDNSERGVRSGGGSVVYITNSSSSTEFPYTNGNYGIVYVNGQQVLPQTAETAAILSMGGNI